MHGHDIGGNARQHALGALSVDHERIEIPGVDADHAGPGGQGDVELVLVHDFHEWLDAARPSPLDEARQKPTLTQTPDDEEHRVPPGGPSTIDLGEIDD